MLRNTPQESNFLKHKCSSHFRGNVNQDPFAFHFSWLSKTPPSLFLAPIFLLGRIFCTRPFAVHLFSTRWDRTFCSCLHLFLRNVGFLAFLILMRARDYSCHFETPVLFRDFQVCLDPGQVFVNKVISGCNRSLYFHSLLGRSSVKNALLKSLFDLHLFTWRTQQFRSPHWTIFIARFFLHISFFNRIMS